jgi:ketosteroid isomerase-like protein
LSAIKRIDAASNSRLDETMKSKTVVITLALGFAAAAICVAADAKVEQTLRKLDAEWSAAAAAKDVDKTVSYYSSDAIVLPPNTKAATTKAAIRKQWKGDLDSMISGSWKATRVEVAKSGDMAYVSGTYKWTSKDASGKTVNDHGKYLEVFEKQADGSWKCGADCWNSDLPVAEKK